jgi:hypothetical protein
MNASLVSYLTETASELVERAKSAESDVAEYLLLEAEELNYLATKLVGKTNQTTQDKMAA